MAEEDITSEFIDNIAVDLGFDKLELSVEDPPIYEFKIKGPYGSSKTGQVSVYEDGSIKNVIVD